MRARQVARPDRPRPFPCPELRKFSRECASFSGGLAMTGFLQASCFHYPIALRCIYTIALYCYYPITLYHVYLIVSREGWTRPPGSAAPHPVADKLFSLFFVRWI